MNCLDHKVQKLVVYDLDLVTQKRIESGHNNSKIE